MVLISAAVTIALSIFSNTLTGTFTVANIPMTISWTGGTNPDNVAMVKESWYEYNIRVQNPSSSAYDGAYLRLTITGSDPQLTYTEVNVLRWSDSSTNWVSTGSQFLGPNAYFTMTANGESSTIPAGYDGVVHIRIIFFTPATAGNYSYTLNVAGA